MVTEVGSSNQGGREQVLERRECSHHRRSTPCRVVSIFYGGVMKDGIGER